MVVQEYVTQFVDVQSLEDLEKELEANRKSKESKFEKIQAADSRRIEDLKIKIEALKKAK